MCVCVRVFVCSKDAHVRASRKTCMVRCTTIGMRPSHTFHIDFRVTPCTTPSSQDFVVDLVRILSALTPRTAVEEVEETHFRIYLCSDMYILYRMRKRRRTSSTQQHLRHQQAGMLKAFRVFPLSVWVSKLRYDAYLSWPGQLFMSVCCRSQGGVVTNRTACSNLYTGLTMAMKTF